MSALSPVPVPIEQANFRPFTRWLDLLRQTVLNLYTTTEVDALILTAKPVLGTSVASTSGTSIDFTGIPSGTKRVTVMLDGVSTNGTSNIQIQIGDSGGIETASYISRAEQTSSAATTSTAGFIITSANGAGAVWTSNIILTLVKESTFTWITSGVTGDNSLVGNVITFGNKSLSAELDRVRITTLNGTDAFDAGLINISYE